MRLLFVPRVAATALFFSLITLAGAAHAQVPRDIVGGASRTELTGGAGSTARPGRPPRTRSTTPRPINVIKVAPTKIIKAKPTTGTLSVAAEPRATITLVPLGGGVAKEGEVPPNERIFTFVDLKPGRYRVQATLDDAHDDAKPEEVRIEAGKPSNVTLELPLLTYDVTINANVPTGEIIYALVQDTPDPATGKVIQKRIGKVGLAFIQNGKAVLTELQPGTYGIDIRTDQVGYQDLNKKFTLKDDVSYTVTLEKRLSEEQLLANWDVFKSKWEAPAGWRINSDSTSLQVRGRGIAVHRDEKYRYYADFELQSDIKLRNKAGVSFAVHASDPQNYYLIQLTGAEADEPYVLRGFVIRNGARQSFGEPQSIRPFTSTLTSSQPFTVTMKMQGNKLSVFLTDNETGRTQPAGVLTDLNAVFPIGAVGMAAADREEYDVISFLLCKDCMRRK